MGVPGFELTTVIKVNRSVILNFGQNITPLIKDVVDFTQNTTDISDH